jgi:hypothetical protein
MDIPSIEQAKIQAQVLVPLLKTLQAELGEEQANAIVNKAIGEFYRKLGQAWWHWEPRRDPGAGERMDLP